MDWTKTCERMEAERWKAVQEFESQHGREIGPDALFIRFKCVS